MDRFVILPTDVICYLTTKLPVDSIRLLWQTLVSFKRYDDPNHRLWQEIYHRRVSTYPITQQDQTYRDQLFWAVAQFEQSSIWKTHRALAGLGYDRLLPDGLPRDPCSVVVMYYSVMTIAAKAGYMSIVYKYLPQLLRLPEECNMTLSKLLTIAGQKRDDTLIKTLVSSITDLTNTRWIRAAAASGYIPLLDEFLPTARVELWSEWDKRDLYRHAAMSGSIEMVRHLELLVSAHPNHGLRGAVSSGNVELMDYMLHRGGTINNDLVELATKKPKMASIIWLAQHGVKYHKHQLSMVALRETIQQ